MSRLKLLAACGELPWPSDTGHKLVSISDLRYLSDNFEVDVVNLVSNSISEERLEKSLVALREQLPSVSFKGQVRHDISGKHSKLDKGVQLLKAYVAGVPYIVSKYRNREYVDKIRSLLVNGNYDAILVESTPLSFLVSDVPEIAESKIPVIFRAHDILSETISKFGSNRFALVESWLAKIEAFRTKRFEEFVWSKSSVIAPVTKRLTSIISERIGQSGTRSIMYLPVPISCTKQTESAKDQGSGLVLYVGTIHYPPNLQGLLWFINKVWPLILETRPDAKFRIIGKGGDLLGVKHSSIEVLDYVADLEEHYSKADVLVVPLFSGSGIRLKILESFSNGIPVVSTTEGYLGLDIVPGEQLLASDNHAEFALRVAEVLESAVLRNSLRTKAKEFLMTNHSVLEARSAFEHLKTCVSNSSIH